MSRSEVAQDWLGQFTDDELPAARALADAILLVGRDELFRGLRVLLDELLLGRSNPETPLALYAERVVDVDRGEDEDGRWYEVEPFFPASGSGRATGEGVPPVVAEGQEVGSEGPVSNFITSYERAHRGLVLAHPGPDELRSAKVREIVIVTDFIGSGKRITEQLEAFWQVATIRSWMSFKLVRFVVVAYSGTEAGLEQVRKHRVRPEVRIVKGCPTIHDSFSGENYAAVLALCRKYARGARFALGFRNGGVLIAFAHGMPNNAPPIFHRGPSDWQPLFPNRSTVEADTVFIKGNADDLAVQAEEQLRIRLAVGELTQADTRQWLKTMLVLTALERGLRSAYQVSAATQFPLEEVQAILTNTRIAHWISRTGALTDLGRRELIRLRQRRQRRIELPSEDQPFYYPSQLRAR